MSQERRRVREARQLAVAAERERAARRAARRQRLPSLPGRTAATARPVARRQSTARFGRLPLRTRLLLGFSWLAVQFVVWQLVSDDRTRVGLGVVSAFAVPVAVVVFAPRSRRSR
ncbi:MAG: hypothetical protein M3N21_07650 [Actinomycetota bacterium]|nr:hypothetical protein [Actinomycetota bacterium]